MINLYIDELLFLCNKIIFQPIPLEEFYKMYDFQFEEDKLYQHIMDNIESLLEHVPSNNILSSNYSMEKYKNMKEHKILESDIQLLNYIKENKITNIDKVLNQRYLNLHRIEKSN